MLMAVVMSISIEMFKKRDSGDNDDFLISLLLQITLWHCYFKCMFHVQVHWISKGEEEWKWSSHLTVNYEIADLLDQWGITIDICVHL